MGMFENRFVYFSGVDKPKLTVENLDPLQRKKELAEKGALPIDELVHDSNRLVDTYEDQLADLPDDFKSVLHDNIVDYFMTSADRYDNDSEVGLDAIEFSKYSDDMLAKLRGILDQYAPSKEQLEVREKQKEAVADAQEVVAGIGSVELADVAFDPVNLNTPEGIQGELVKFNQRSEGFRTQAGDMADKVGRFQEAYNRFEESKLSWRALYQGTIIGKIAGWSSDEANGLRSTLDELRAGLDSNLSRLREERVVLADYGAEMDQAGNDLRSKAQQKLAQVKNRGSEFEQTRFKDRKQYSELQSQRLDLSAKRGEMASYLYDLRAQADVATRSQNELTVKEEQLGEFSGMVDSSLLILDTALRNDNLSEPQRKALEEKRDDLMDRQNLVVGGIESVDQLRGSVGQASEQREDMISQVRAGTVDIDTYLSTTVDPALSSIDESMRLLEIAALQNGSQSDRIEAEYAIKIDAIDEVDALVADNVIDNNLANTQLLGFLESQKQFIDSVNVEDISLWNATGGFVLGNLGRGLNFLSTGVYDRVQDLMIDLTKDIPVVNVGTEIFANWTVGMVSGVLSGAGELASGLNMLIDKPTTVLRGMGSLIGRDPVTGEFSSGTAGDAWKTMGKALIAWDNFAEGDWGKGIGKVGFNVLLTLTGLGVAGDAAKGAASVAYLAAREMGAGALSAGVRAGFAGTRAFVVETSSGLARLPGEIIGAPGRVLRLFAGNPSGNILDDMARLESSISEMTICRRFPKLAGMSARELHALSPTQLVRMGVVGSRSYVEFVALVTARNKLSRLGSTVGRSSGRIIGGPQSVPGRRGGASFPRRGPKIIGEPGTVPRRGPSGKSKVRPSASERPFWGDVRYREVPGQHVGLETFLGGAKANRGDKLIIQAVDASGEPIALSWRYEFPTEVIFDNGVFERGAFSFWDSQSSFGKALIRPDSSGHGILYRQGVTSDELVPVGKITSVQIEKPASFGRKVA
ncbi:MAG: hypothetical protein UV80_C0003G0001 [Candidatus Peregrinibacteria bacterium GW2011_GWF2_43_17]|nr:MAG: hypothetical protein UV80_C0003G0001 [Candidatus Peregrinibacteria bacterium GW2011_GWF2_43_17]KKT19941.1 MAG: hypothetical protein UW03_C0012G0010 [Candidatus Peregrinibacteria bacterium GW2011_GWA2_43_8]HAU40139.1 hypothetical protein [Candidatus Peregrinibacteria bacterium]